MDLLRETEHTTHCPWKGDTATTPSATSRRRPGPIPSRSPAWSGCKGLVAFHFDALDEWLEEDEPVIGHPRDPFHRIDVNRSSRHVKVTLDGETLAESDRPLALFETGLPTRWYLPREDVNMDRLQPSGRARPAPTRATPRRSRQAGTTTSPGPTPTRRGGRGRSATGSRSTTSSWTSRSTASARRGPSARSRGVSPAVDRDLEGAADRSDAGTASRPSPLDEHAGRNALDGVEVDR